MKKQIKAEIIADSTNEYGQRITSFVLTFPRFILAELNTHRVFSRNSASSRAIPFKKMVEMVKEDTFTPIAWQKDHSGMQGTEYFEGHSIEECEYIWLSARDKAVEEATYLHENGVTKQLCNRLLEPFMWHTTIVTATEFENFFELRCPKYYFEPEERYYRSKKDWCKAFGESWDGYIPDWDTSRDYLWWAKMNHGQGEIHIMELAEAMWDTMNENIPKQLECGEWHIPFGDSFKDMKIHNILRKRYEVEQGKPSSELSIPQPEYAAEFFKVKLKIASSRCARISYLNFEGKDDYEADLRLYDQLTKSGHFSPLEHCARAMTFSECNWTPDEECQNGWSGNFRGFIQLRKLVENEK